MAGRFLIIFLFILLHSCQVENYLYYNLADINDHRIFPSVTVEKTAHASMLPLKTDRCYDTLSGNLEKNHTVAFLIYRDDTLRYERYFNGYSRASVLPSFSVTKSFVTALTGIALHEGWIRSVDQPVTDYIPEMKDSLFRSVTIRDLLEMRAGLNYNERGIGPFGKVAVFYYGNDLTQAAYRLKVIEKPGQRFAYQSGATQLLGMIVERATGKLLPIYLQETIWKPVGMEYDATWSIDSEKHLVTKAFCCLNARAVDFLRFGVLMLNKGVWQGDTIISPRWIEEALEVKDSAGQTREFYHGYNFRILPNGDYFMKGVHGQYIYVNPASSTVIVRFGKQAGRTEWIRLFQGISS